MYVFRVEPQLVRDDHPGAPWWTMRMPPFIAPPIATPFVFYDLDTAIVTECERVPAHLRPRLIEIQD